MPGTGQDTPTELALAQAINANQAQLAETGNPYNTMLGQELQRVSQQDTQAREEANYQNALYLNSLYGALAGAGIPEPQIINMLTNAYNMANIASMNTAAPQMATDPFVPQGTTQKKGLLDAIANAQGMHLQGLGLLPQLPAAPVPTIQMPSALAPLAQPVSSPAAPATQYALPQVSLTNINPAEFIENGPYVTPIPALAVNPVMDSLLPMAIRQKAQQGPMRVRLPA